ESDFAQRDDHLDLGQELQLSEQIGLAVGNFLALRFICWGSTVECLGDKTIVQLQTVVAVCGHGLIGKTMRVQCPIEPFPTAVASKSPAGAVAAMGGWRQTKHEEPGLRVTKTGDGFAPIGFLAKTAYFLRCHVVQVSDQARAQGTPDDV